MYKQKNNVLLLLIGILFTFITLYLPQPLQPALAARYGRSASEGGLLTTVTLIPLALSPLFHEYLFAKTDPAKLLKNAWLGLGLCNLAFASIHHFPLLLSIRFLSGCLIPIILTATITLLLEDNTKPQKTLSLYITFTIIGGFSGRFLSSLFDTYLNWQSFSCLSGAILLLLGTRRLPPSRQKSSVYRRPRLKDLLTLLKIRKVTTVLLIIYATFGSFVALLNYLPFLLRQSFPHASNFVTGVVYSGYIFSAVIALLSAKIIATLGVKRTLVLANLVFLASLVLLFVNSLVLTFFVLFAFCGAFFLTHAVAIAEVNLHSPYPKSLTNAFYTMFYYSGGVVGSYLPGLIFQYHGKIVFLATLLVVSLSATLAILTLPGAVQAKPSDDTVRPAR